MVNMRKKATGSRTEKIMDRRLRRRRRISRSRRVRLNPPRGGVVREERSKRPTDEIVAEGRDDEEDEEKDMDVLDPIEFVDGRVMVVLLRAVRLMLMVPE